MKKITKDGGSNSTEGIERNEQGMTERAQKLIEALYGHDLSAELHERLRDWLLGIPEGGVSEETLAQWFAANIEPDVSIPGKEERERFRRLSEMLAIDIREERAPEEKRRRVFNRRFAARAAAVLVPVLVVAGASLLLLGDKEAAEVDSHDVAEIILVADNEGGKERFTLPDGSNVTLEHGSKLVYASDFATGRRVRLDGEAFFEVARDTVHPFSVNNGDLRVVVLGTKFKMTAHDAQPEAEVILVSGSVAVEIGELSQKLAPNDRLRLDKSTLSVTEHSQLGPGAIMRAAGSDLCIEDVRIVEALGIAADYFEKKIVIEEEGLELQDRLNIILPHDMSFEAALASLSRLSENAKFEVTGDTILVSKK